MVKNIIDGIRLLGTRHRKEIFRSFPTNLEAKEIAFHFGILNSRLITDLGLSNKLIVLDDMTRYMTILMSAVTSCQDLLEDTLKNGNPEICASADYKEFESKTNIAVTLTSALTVQLGELVKEAKKVADTVFEKPADKI